jgi:PAS domain S-box-containing protein
MTECRQPAIPDTDELLRAVVESSTDFAVFAMDLNGAIISWNLGAERLVGYAEAEILGSDGRIIFTPEDRAAGVPEREQQTALGAGRAEDERWHVRKDGSRFWGSGLLMPLRDGVQGYVKILRDRTQQHRIEEDLRESEARFRMLATNIPQLVFRSRSTGHRTWGSPQWAVFTGLSDRRSRDFGWLDAVHPDDRDLTVTKWREAQRGGDYHVEHRIRRISDGAYRWHQTRATPLPEGDATEVEWIGTSTDIHDLRSLQDHQQLLLAELQHRTRNLLAVVQAMARQTVRTSPSLQAFATEFEGRLHALSHVQSLLARTDNKMIDLRAIVEAELAAHGSNEGKVKIEGPPFDLSPSAAQTMALALHELATNAAKYGALKQPSGQLAVTWRVDDEAGKRRILVDWRERGVTMGDQGPPKRKGYGSELIERALPYQLMAKTQLQFEPDGVHCSIAVPVAAVHQGVADG